MFGPRVERAHGEDNSQAPRRNMTSGSLAAVTEAARASLPSKRGDVYSADAEEIHSEHQGSLADSVFDETVGEIVNVFAGGRVPQGPNPNRLGIPRLVCEPGFGFRHWQLRAGQN